MPSGCALILTSSISTTTSESVGKPAGIDLSLELFEEVISRALARMLVVHYRCPDISRADAMDPLDGKPVQATEISGRDGEAIEIETPIPDTQTRARALSSDCADEEGRVRK